MKISTVTNCGNCPFLERESSYCVHDGTKVTLSQSFSAVTKCTIPKKCPLHEGDVLVTLTDFRSKKNTSTHPIKQTK